MLARWAPGPLADDRHELVLLPDGRLAIAEPGCRAGSGPWPGPINWVGGAGE